MGPNGTGKQRKAFREQSLSKRTTHLLGDHYDKRSQRCAPDARDGEELEETLDIGAVTNDFCFNLNLRIDGVKIARCKQVMVPEWYASWKRRFLMYHLGDSISKSKSAKET
ncbi:MAG: hypothetical protein Q9227_000956 [Pyrenula ochraceoflavens]